MPRPWRVWWRKRAYRFGQLPDDVIQAMGAAAIEIMDELSQDEDELVRRITESFLAYRDSVGSYMSYADNGQMNARAGVLGY